MIDYTHLETLKAEVIESMLDYMTDEDDPDFDSGYERQHVDRCGALLDAFINSTRSIDPSSGPEQILATTKETVLALNALNAECEGSLIETDQREMICDLLLAALAGCGYDGDDDVTEEWREW
jgi:hypothetical protein